MMKSYGFRLAVCSFTILTAVFFFSYTAQAQMPQRPQYLVLKGGIYSPQTESLKDYKTGFNMEGAFGYQFDRNWAIEAGAGYFETNAKKGWVYGSETGWDSIQLRVVPLTVAVKGSIPADRAELYGIGGVGVYFMETRVDYGDRYYNRGDYDDKDTETLFGGFLGAGVRFHVSPKMFFGLEGKYLWTTQSTFTAAETDLNGLQAPFVVGFRF